MISPLLVCKLFLISTLVYTAATGSAIDNGDVGYGECERKVRRWEAKALKELEWGSGSKKQLQDLLFFLHIPRTGGRTYFYCFLRKLYTTNLECPRSYDKLRFDPSKPNCRLMVTHDDYSILSRLPKERTSVVTILRNPVDRVFSIYEFAIEVAARFLAHPKLSSSVHRTHHMNSRAGVVSTLDIWPWKYLVPWMREDIFARRKARRVGKAAIPEVVEDSYNFSTMAMPLHEFIHHSLAHNIIHNGATFQVAGLTDKSQSEEAWEIRQCAVKYIGLGHHVLKVAKKRLDEMLYVGLTENHKESATMFAKMVGEQIMSQLEHLNQSIETAKLSLNNKTGSDCSLSCTGCKDKIETKAINKKLMVSYEECISALWGSQSTRRISSLSGIAPANFSKEARSHVHKFIINDIEILNNLDVELYKYGQNIFAQQQNSLRREQETLRQQSNCQSEQRSMTFNKVIEISGAEVKGSTGRRSQQLPDMEKNKRALGCLVQDSVLELITVAPIVFILLLLVQRRTSKPTLQKV